jgi:hypothetical protein
MKIKEIKHLTRGTAPYFFSNDTLKFFGQTLEDFNVEKVKDGRYKIKAIERNAPHTESHYTIRYFNPDSNELELK